MKWLARRMALLSVAGVLIMVQMAGTALAQNASGASISGTDEADAQGGRERLRGLGVTESGWDRPEGRRDG